MIVVPQEHIGWTLQGAYQLQEQVIRRYVLRWHQRAVTVKHVRADQISANDSKGWAWLQSIDYLDNALQGSARLEVTQRATGHNVRICKMHKTKICLRRPPFHCTLLCLLSQARPWGGSTPCAAQNAASSSGVRTLRYWAPDTPRTRAAHAGQSVSSAAVPRTMLT